jgi:hypothetical protein
MGNKRAKRKPTHLDYNSRTEKRLVFDKRTGDFKEPTAHYIQTIPVDLIAPLHSLPKSAVFTWLACWFLHGCNRGKPFKLNQSTARRFGLNAQNRRRGLRALEKLGLVQLHRRPGRLSLVEIIKTDS